MYLFSTRTHTGDTFPVITTHIIENFQGPAAVEQSARGDEINRVTFLFLFFSLFYLGALHDCLNSSFISCFGVLVPWTCFLLLDACVRLPD